jgi:hypothetical protein
MEDTFHGFPGKSHNPVSMVDIEMRLAQRWQVGVMLLVPQHQPMMGTNLFP